nr:hypothetical protein [Paenibacillus xylanexedens]
MEKKLELIAAISIFIFLELLILFFIFSAFVGLFDSIKLKMIRKKSGNTSTMEPCVNCGHQIARNADRCPSCGSDFGGMYGVLNSTFGCILMICGLSPLALLLVVQILEIFKEW